MLHEHSIKSHQKRNQYVVEKPKSSSQVVNIKLIFVKLSTQKAIIMKSIFTILLVIIAFSLQAQKITVNPVQSIENFENADLTNNNLDLETHIAVGNNTDEQIQLVWTRIIKENCPEEWETAICDNVTCYFTTISSNVNPEIGLNAPFILEQNETFNDFILHVKPRTVPGCCRVKVEFTTVEEPDVVLETAVFDVSINTENCDFSTNVQEVAEAQLVNVYPNPTSDAFTLTNNDVIKHIDLYNNLGQKLKSFDYENGEYFNVSDLNPGIYSLVLKNAEGLSLHTVMLNRS